MADRQPWIRELLLLISDAEQRLEELRVELRWLVREATARPMLISPLSVSPLTDRRTRCP